MSDPLWAKRLKEDSAFAEFVDRFIEEDEMSSGREHYERRIKQQRAADKRRVKRKSDIDWKKEEEQ